MAKYNNGNLTFPSTFKIEKTAPIDDRFVVESINDLTNGTIDYPYVGMVVNIEGSVDLYTLIGLPVSNIDNWKRIKGADEIDEYNDTFNTKFEKQVEDLIELIQKTKDDILGGEGLDETLDTIKEIASWITDHQDLYENLVESTTQNLKKAVEELNTIINDLENKVDNRDAELDDKIESTKSELKELISFEIENLNNIINGNNSNANDKISKLSEALNQESIYRRDNDEILLQIINAETERSTTVESQLKTSIEQEIIDRTNNDKTISDNLIDETNNRILNDNDINERISTYRQQLDERDNALEGKIEQEKQDRLSYDIEIRENILFESRESKERDNILQTNIDNEAKLRVDGDDEIKNTIEETIQYLKDQDFEYTKVLIGLIDETKDELKSDIQTLSNTHVQDKNDMTSYVNETKDELLLKIQEEENVRISEDTRLEGLINTERTSRIENDELINKRIDSEERTRENNDNNLRNSITAEEDARKSADDHIITSLDTEIVNRNNSVLNLNTKIESTKSELIENINKVKSDLIGVGLEDKELNTFNKVANWIHEHETDFNELSEYVENLNTIEQTTRKNADDLLKSNIDNEQLARETSDANLKTDIENEIKNRNDGDERLKDIIESTESKLSEDITNLRNELLGSESIIETLDSITEISTWINEHKSEFDTLNNFAKELAVNEAQAREEGDNKLKQLIIDEQTSRQNKDVELETLITNNNNARIAIEADLTTKLTSEINTRKTETSEIKTNLTNEISNRDSADKLLEGKINSEATIRQTSDDEIKTSLSQETSARILADSDLLSKIQDEENKRSLEDGKLNNSITEETNKRKIGDDTLQNNIDKVKNDLTEVINQLMIDLLGGTEIGEGEQGTILESIKEIPQWINTHSKEYATLKKFVEDFKEIEEQTRQTVDSELQKSIDDEAIRRENAVDDLQTKLNNEANTRKTDDDALRTDLNTEITRSTGVEDALRTDLTNEINARTDADTILQNNIDLEIDAREKGDDAINTRIDNVDDKFDAAVDEVKYYRSKALDHWLTEPIGGIKGGLTRRSSEITNKTFSEIFDLLLYPVLQPVIKEPTTSLIYNNDDTDGAITSLLVDDMFPPVNEFINTYDRGSVNYTNTNGDKYYAGDVTVNTLTVDGDIIFGDRLTTPGIYTVTYTVTFGEGSELRDNKNEVSTISKYTGGTITKTKQFNVICPIYANTDVINAVSSQGVHDYFQKDSNSFIITIPNETETNKFEIHVPSDLTLKVYQSISFNNTFEGIVNMKNVGTVNHNGIEYYKYVRTQDVNSIQGESVYKIVLE